MPRLYTQLRQFSLYSYEAEKETLLGKSQHDFLSCCSGFGTAIKRIAARKDWHLAVNYRTNLLCVSSCGLGLDWSKKKGKKVAVPFRVCGMCVPVSRPECGKTELQEQSWEGCQNGLVWADRSWPNTHRGKRWTWRHRRIVSVVGLPEDYFVGDCFWEKTRYRF